MQSLVLKLFKAQCLRHLKQHKGDFTAGSKIKDLVFKAETKAKLDILSGTVGLSWNSAQSTQSGLKGLPVMG